MTTIAVLVIIFCMLLIGLFLLGPKVRIDESIQQSLLPIDIDQYLFEQESNYGDIKPNTEKTIVWHNPVLKNKTTYAFIFLHGYSASRQEIFPVTEVIAERYQANLFLARLTGHGRPSAAMKEITVNKLLNDAKQALDIGKRLGDQVILIGNSTGATLATWLATQYPGDIHSLIFLSPNFALKQKRAKMLLWPWSKIIVRLMQGKEYKFVAENEQQEAYWTTTYHSDALVPLMGLLKLVHNKPLENITHPTLAIYCPYDQVIDVSIIEDTLRRFGSKQLIIDRIKSPDGSKQHIICGDILSPSTTDEVIDKIDNFLQLVIEQRN